MPSIHGRSLMLKVPQWLWTKSSFIVYEPVQNFGNQFPQTQRRVLINQNSILRGINIHHGPLRILCCANTISITSARLASDFLSITGHKIMGLLRILCCANTFWTASAGLEIMMYPFFFFREWNYDVLLSTRDKKRYKIMYTTKTIQ